MKFTPFLLAAIASAGSAFSPLKGPASRTNLAVKSAAANTVDRPIRDPFGLYPVNSPERKEGRIIPLESPAEKDKTIIDPLNLYADKSNVNTSPADMSLSLPFLKRPETLDGSLPGDRGFDPFNFSSDEKSLQWYRNAEIKHARLAMLAAVGWPLAELLNKNIDRVPSVLNGGLSQINPVFWGFVLTVLSAVEVVGLFNEGIGGEKFLPGDFGFDPFGLFGKTEEERKFKLDAEIFNGRLAMLAIVGFAIQEWWTQSAVIDLTPFFFKPLWDAATSMM